MSLNTSSAVTKLRSLTQRFDHAVVAANPFYPTLCTDVPSDGADEEYGMLGAVPGVREWLGDRSYKELREANWTIRNKLWEQSLQILRQDMEDDRLGKYDPVAEQLGIRAAHHPDVLLMSLINGAESGECFDGQYYFDTDHVWGQSGTQSNLLSPTAANTASVTTAEFKAAFNAAIAALYGFKDDQGQLLNDEVFEQNDGSNLAVVVPAALRQTAYDALTAALATNGGTNVVLNRPRIITANSYTATTSFDLYKIDAPLKPYIFQRRTPLKRQLADLDNIKEKAVKLLTEARYNVGYGAWWCAVRSTFTAA